MTAEEFYKAQETAPLPNLSDLIEIDEQELFKLMEEYTKQYHKENLNKITDNEILEGAENEFPEFYDDCTGGTIRDGFFESKRLGFEFVILFSVFFH